MRYKISSKLCLNFDLGVNGNMFGGRLMALMDEAAAIFAIQSTGEKNVVSRNFSAVEFRYPVKLGDILEFWACNPKRGKTSIAFDLEVLVDGIKRFTASCVFVAVDEHGNKKEIDWDSACVFKRDNQSL